MNLFIRFVWQASSSSLSEMINIALASCFKSLDVTIHVWYVIVVMYVLHNYISSGSAVL